MIRARVFDDSELADMFLEQSGHTPDEEPELFDVFAQGVRDELKDEVWSGAIASVEYDQITGER